MKYSQKDHELARKLAKEVLFSQGRKADLGVKAALVMVLQRNKIPAERWVGLMSLIEKKLPEAKALLTESITDSLRVMEERGGDPED